MNYPPEPRVLRPDMAWLRISGYLVVGALLSAGFAAIIDWLPLAPPVDEIRNHAYLLALGLSGFAASLALVVWRRRIQIDSAGIGRRRWFRWENWSWQELGSGDWTYDQSCQLQWHGKDSARALDFSWLSADDGRFVARLVRAVFPEHFAAPDVLPAHLTIRPRNARTFRLCRSGIILPGWFRPQRYRWNQVRRIALVRATHEDFLPRWIECDLDRRRIRLFPDATSAHEWALALTPFLIGAAGPSRIVSPALNDEPRSAAEAVFVREHFEIALRSVRRVQLLLAAGSALLLLSFPLGVLNFGTAKMFGVIVCMYQWAVKFGLERAARRRLDQFDKIEEWPEVEPVLHAQL